MRVGFGYDSHCFSDEPSSETGALIHAIIDALLGAAALGDIGSHFPDDDPRWANANSAVLLCSVVKEIGDAGYAVGNVDATVICEMPRLSPYVEAIRSRLAGFLDVDESSVSVKGKTNEGMDAVGQGLGIAVHAVALLVPAEA